MQKRERNRPKINEIYDDFWENDLDDFLRYKETHLKG